MKERRTSEFSSVHSLTFFSDLDLLFYFCMYCACKEKHSLLLVNRWSIKSFSSSVKLFIYLFSCLWLNKKKSRLRKFRKKSTEKEKVITNIRKNHETNESKVKSLKRKEKKTLTEKGDNTLRDLNLQTRQRKKKTHTRQKVGPTKHKKTWNLTFVIFNFVVWKTSNLDEKKTLSIIGFVLHDKNQFTPPSRANLTTTKNVWQLWVCGANYAKMKSKIAFWKHDAANSI